MTLNMNMENQGKEADEKRIMKEFARRRLTHWAIMIVAIIIVVLIWYIRATMTNTWPMWVLAAIVLAGVIYSYIDWKCPSCKQYLGRGYNPAKCPNCGTKLRKQK